MDDVVILGQGTGHGGSLGAFPSGPVEIDLGGGAGVVLREGTGVTHGGFPLSVVVPELPEGIFHSLGVLAPCPVLGWDLLLVGLYMTSNISLFQKSSLK